MAGVELESFGENPDQVKAARIPNYWKDDLFSAEPSAVLFRESLRLVEASVANDVKDH
jgi:hypothetical protein